MIDAAAHHVNRVSDIPNRHIYVDGVLGHPCVANLQRLEMVVDLRFFVANALGQSLVHTDQGHSEKQQPVGLGSHAKTPSSSRNTHLLVASDSNGLFRVINPHLVAKPVFRNRHIEIAFLESAIAIVYLFPHLAIVEIEVPITVKTFLAR